MVFRLRSDYNLVVFHGRGLWTDVAALKCCGIANVHQRHRCTSLLDFVSLRKEKVTGKAMVSEQN